MASTYSALKFELITTGEQSGTWGDTTNTNIGTAIQEAITGSADVTFSGSTVTLTLSDSNAAQTARNLRLNLTGTSGGAQNLIVPAIEKQYIVSNGCADAITIKNSTGTGIAVPAGKTMVVFNNGTNVVDVTTHATSLTLGSALPVTSGGTGVTTSTGTGSVVLNSAPSITNATLVTPALGTPQSGTLTNCTGLPVATGISGLGTGVATFLATPSSSNLAAAVTGETGSGALVFATSPTLVTPVLGTPSSGTLTSCTGLPLTTGVTGTLPIANGGTGSTSTTYCSLTTNVTGTLPVANGGTGVTTSTGTGNVVLSASPTLTGTPIAPTAAGGTNTTQIATTAFVTSAVSTATGSLGTMSTQNANAVAITGGTINGATIGASTASTIRGTTITATTGFTGDLTGTASAATSVTGSTSNGFGTRTVSTSSPTGGSNGDIWYQY